MLLTDMHYFKHKLIPNTLSLKVIMSNRRKCLISRRNSLFYTSDLIYFTNSQTVDYIPQIRMQIYCCNLRPNKNKMQSFDEFKNTLESKVAGIASKMTALYSQRCTSSTAQCSTKSYSQCQGTDNYQCLNTFPKKQGCLDPGISVSKSSGVRLPNSLSFDSLTNEQKLLVCVSTMLDQSFKDAKLALLDKIGRMYVGTSFGMFRSYPALHRDSSNGVCAKDYDPRFRPWYVSATSGSKNLILIIDVSGSMQGTPLQIAKNAAKSVIDTLGLGDFVGVISFSDQAKFLAFQSVKRATNYVKQTIKIAIDNLSSGGSTNYQAAFTKSKEMFNSAQNDQYGTQCPSATNVVLFLTDGTPTTGQTTAEGLINQINQWNGQFNIKLFSYGLGEAYNLQILRKLSCTYQGIVFKIQNSESNSQLLNTMSSYYIYLTQGLNITQPVWSEPYDDFLNGARKITASMPIYHTQNSIKVVVGVAGIDVTLASLQSFGISEKQISIRLLKNTPCLTLSLDACQLQNLRPSSVKCNIPNCSNPEPFTPCPISVYSSVLKTPPTTHKAMHQCCGLTIGALVGIVIGSVAAVIILAVMIFCYRKYRKARQAQANQPSEQKLNNGLDTLGQQKPQSGQDLKLPQDPYPNIYVQEMQSPYIQK